MASAQVLPNNAAASTAAKKKELLAAGKRKLEDYRKKKALEKEKNAAAARESRDVNDKQSSQKAEVSHSDNDEMGSSNRTDKTTDALSSSHGAVESLQNGVHSSDGGLFSSPPPFLNKVGSYGSAVSAKPKVNEAERVSPLVDFKVSDVYKDTRGESGMYNGYQSGHTGSEASDYHPSTSLGSDDNSRELDNNNNFSFRGPDSSHTFVSSVSSESSGTSVGERRYGNFFGHIPTPHSTPPTVFEPRPITLESDKRYPDHALAESAKTTSTSRKSRPSFLDTIKVSNPTPSTLPVQRNQANTIVSNSSALPILYTESKIAETYKSYGPSQNDNALEKPFDLPTSANNGSYPFNSGSNGNWMDHEQMYRSKMQDEDFAALEQHIEDLTQEKFSLQRAIEASRSLAESLAAENSALTESYNNQGSVVNQLKFEMERLQEEIRGQSAELEATKSEYGNVLLECNASDERAKLLASEVISLEEKALRLRSNELKLERQLETAQSEASSLKKKMSSLERERQDLQASIAAFQEGEIARVGAGVFLVLQLISVIEFIAWWNTYCIPDDKRRQSFGLFMSTVFYIASICGILVMYPLYGSKVSCALNIFFITWTAVLLLVMMAISYHTKVNRGLLSSGIMASYLVFLCWSAIRSEPTSEFCKPQKLETGNAEWTAVVGFLIAIGAIVMATFSTGIDSQSFQFSKDEMKSEDDIPYGHGFFHLIFSLGAMYFAMLFISWNLNNRTVKWSIDVGWASTWVKILNEWFAATIYIWKILSPSLRQTRVTDQSDQV